MLDQVLNDEEIKAIINNVNNVIIVNNYGCHGMGHVIRVMNYAETLLRGLKADEHTIELGKISAYLHDIGAIMGKDGHAKRSAEFTNNYLTKLNMNEEDKKMIVDAIENHSKGSETLVGAALTFADKIDMQAKRMLRFKDDNKSHDNIKHMMDIELSVDDNIVVNIVTDGIFDYNFFKDYNKMIIKPVEMSKHLGKECVFKVDGEIVDLYSIAIGK